MLPNIKRAPSPNWEPRKKGPPRFVVIHATASHFSSAFGWLRNPLSRVSAHYLIDRDGTTYQLVDEDKVAWHAGLSFWRGLSGLNAYSIGIELVNLNNGKDPYPEAQCEACARLVADICRRWQIPVDRQHIVGHYEISPGRKTDPRGLDLDAVVTRALQPSTYWVTVTADVLNVRQGPKTSYPIVYQLRKGDSVECDATKDEGEGVWHHLANGAGFISGKYVK